MFRKCNLKIGCLNICGNARAKCTTSDIINIVNDHDIFIITESWLDQSDSCPIIPGFSNFRSERKRKCKARRNSGGIIVYFRQNLGRGIKKISNPSTDILWIKLEHEFFGLEKDIFLCTAYVSPYNSSHKPNAEGDDKFDIIRKDLDLYSTLGYVAIFGDLNSRVGIIQETHISIDTEHAPDLTRVEKVLPRNNRDTFVNSQGRQLLQVLTDYDLLIVNGRVCGDMRGNYTCMQYNGCSQVDMLITDTTLFNKIQYLKVLPFDWYSDHAVVSSSWYVDIKSTTDMPSDWKKESGCFRTGMKAR